MTATRSRSFGSIGSSERRCPVPLKGECRPMHRVSDRIAALTALECVDAVAVFDDDTPALLIEAIRPHVLVKGSDYRPEDVAGREFVEGNGGQLVQVPRLEGLSSTRLRHSLV